MADCCLANLSAIDSVMLRPCCSSSNVSPPIGAGSCPKRPSVFEKTRVSHHSLQKALVTGSIASLIQCVDVCCPLHQSHNDTSDRQFLRCFSRCDLDVESKVVVQRVEHLIAHVAAIWIHSNKTRSSTVNKPIFQQRLLALCGLVVEVRTLSSLRTNSDHRST